MLTQRKPLRGRTRRTAAKGGLQVPDTLHIAERPEDVTAQAARPPGG